MRAVERVEAALQAIRDAGRDEIWISLGDPAELLAEAAAVDARVIDGHALPLAGWTVAVKDNIDVAGFETTAGCPAYAYRPEHDAAAVARLRAAGAIVIGKTNLDQFATGLVGVRSPYGAVRNAWAPERVSGGSSSGSAVAVALGLVDIALGTDTAGSGRVPAALNGVVGIKPTRGLVPTDGVVPACRTLDCVTVFARSIEDARRAMEQVVSEASQVASARVRDREFRAATSPYSAPRVGVPLTHHLGELEPGWAAAFEAHAAAAAAVGVEIVPVDIGPLLEAAAMLYGSAFVAERYSAVGDFVAANRNLIGTDIDATVAGIVLDSAHRTAVDLFRDQQQLESLARRAEEIFAELDALLTPTTTRSPSINAVLADPLTINAAMGRFTNFANLLDLAAVAVPAGTVGGLPFGVMLTGPAGTDQALLGLATRMADPGVELLVVGAHMSGLPLNRDLVECGGTLVRPARTAPEYRLFALPTEPAKPGMVRVEADGAAVAGEIWRLPARLLGRFMVRLPAPMSIGRVRLEDGSDVLGFLCEPVATSSARDISETGGWRAWLAQER